MSAFVVTCLAWVSSACVSVCLLCCVSACVRGARVRARRRCLPPRAPSRASGTSLRCQSRGCGPPGPREGAAEEAGRGEERVAEGVEQGCGRGS